MRYLTTKSVNVFRDYPWLMFVGAVICGSVSALLFHSDGYTMSAALGRGAAAAAFAYVFFLAMRWVEERLAAGGATDNVDHAGSPSGDGG